jgi:S-DNA-T family DNA segregation ATPase FtsK/SpoIIIE
MNIRIAFRVQEQRDVDLILGQGMLKAGWHANKLNAPGKFLVWSPEHDTPRRARAYLITDDDVTDAVTRYAPARPPLDPISRRALAAPPPATARPGDAEGGNDADAGQPEDPEDDPETILRTALSRAPEQGVSVPDLVAATGMSRRWVYYRLRELAAAGHVIQTVRGHWRIAPAGGNRE